MPDGGLPPERGFASVGTPIGVNRRQALISRRLAEVWRESPLNINQADYLWAVAVAHGSRKPGYWKQRVVKVCSGLENSAQAETSTRRLCRTGECRPLAVLRRSEGATHAHISSSNLWFSP
jgi:hypothetical protein